MACHDSSRSPQPRSGSMASASVYVTVSMSGQMASPWSTMSSPVLTMAVTPSGGTTSTSPRSRRRRQRPPPTRRPASLVDPRGRHRGVSPARSCAHVHPCPLGLSGHALELSLEQREVGVHHEVHELLERGLRLPSQCAARLGGVA